MNLRVKMTLIVCAIFICILGIFHIILYPILLNGFQEEELRVTREKLSQAVKVMDENIHVIGATLTDWAMWDDTYTYIQDGNEGYLSSNLVDETFINNHLNIMVFINSSGEIMYEKAYDLNNEMQVPVSENLHELFTAESPLIKTQGTDGITSGIIDIPDTPLLIAGHPILTSEGSGPSRGTLIFGRFLDDEEINAIFTHAGITDRIEIRSISSESLPSDFRTALSTLAGTQEAVQVLGSDTIAGYVDLRDIYGEHALILKVESARPVNNLAQVTVSYFYWSSVFIIIALVCVLIYLNEKMILSRIARITRGVSDIGGSLDSKVRISMTGKDELSKLAVSINGMVDRIQSANEMIKINERKYRTLLENLLEGVCVLSWEGRVNFTNAQFAKMLDRAQPEILGKQFWDFVTEDDRETVKTNIVNYLGGDGKAYDVRLVRISNRPMVVSIGMTPIAIDSNEPDGLLVCIEDVTERRKGEEVTKLNYEKLQEAFLGVTKVISATVEMRDPYTAGHQLRVARLAQKIAREMNLPEITANQIYTAGSIHDIGKIGLPTEILSKTGKLSPIELSLVRTHSQLGYDVLKGIEFPYPVDRWVLEHHERMDSSGYPRGLSGDEISIEARILAVADVVEAISSHRPYRPSLGLDEAIQEISQKRGVLYDSKAVDACLRVLEVKGFQF